MSENIIVALITLGGSGLSLVGIILDDWLRYFLFGEEKPRYKLL